MSSHDLFSEYMNCFELLTDFIEVERELPRNGAIQPRFQISSPILREDILASSILFTDPRHPGIDAFSAIDVFHRCFPEEEQHEVSYVERPNEIWF